jgi:hypothetical protein
MKTLLIILGFTCAVAVKAQPGGEKSISVEKVSFAGKELYFITHNGIDFLSVKDKTVKGVLGVRENGSVGLGTVFNNTHAFNFSSLIHKGDTMRINLQYNKYDNRMFSIKKLTFIKGVFNIDLLACIKKINTKGLGYFVIQDFPCDCLEFQIPEPSLPMVQADSTAIKQ